MICKNLKETKKEYNTIVFSLDMKWKSCPINIILSFDGMNAFKFQYSSQFYLMWPFYC